jgi:hypothetical protein
MHPVRAPSSSLAHRSRLLCLGALAATLTAGCAPAVAPRRVARPAAAPPEVEPPPTAPHALVVLSATYLLDPGGHLDMDAAVDGQVVMRSESLQPQKVALRAKPGATSWHFVSRFYRREWKSVRELEHHDDTERDPCGSHDSRGNCEATWRTVTKSGYETVSHLVDDEVAHCLDDVPYSLDAGHSYRISHVFRGNEQCATTCLDVTDDPAGTPCATGTTAAPPARIVAPAPANAGTVRKK